jgi:FkbM family methyltransferase
MSMAPFEPPQSGARGFVWRWLSEHSDSPAVCLLRRSVERALYYLHADNFDFDTNGEGFLLDCLAGRARTILDVGANRGEWAQEAIRRCPNASIYCFELASPTRDELLRRTGAQPRVHVASCGLASREGTVRVKYYPDRPACTSIHDYPHVESSVWIDEAVTTGDKFLVEAGLAAVDLLKIDTEGSELDVLRGFSAALERGAIRAVQFEYGYAAIVSHGLLIDFYELLEPAGYLIGRLRPRGIDFVPYRFTAESFWGPNYIAVRRDDRDMLRRL